MFLPHVQVFQLCRSLTLLAAKGAKVQAIDGVYTSLKDLDGLRLAFGGRGNDAVSVL